MKVKVGVIGPEDTVNLILEVAKDFSQSMEMFPFVYKTVDDVIDIIRKEESIMNIWVFSGQVPYSLGTEAFQLKQNSFYPELNGSSLTRTLLEVVYKGKTSLERLSLDTLKENEIYETFSELKLPQEGLHLKSYSGYTPPADLLKFHLTLYETGQVDACLTCIRAVYEELKTRNIPTYRITPTRMSVRQTLSMAQKHGETLHFKKSQIAVQIIQMEDINKLVNENTFSYEVYHLDLKLQETILKYVEIISGSLVSLGKGSYMIFSTRGSVEENQSYPPSKLLETIALLTDLGINIGIGYGSTALVAEQNARLGLTHSKNHGGNCCVLVDENGNVEGPLQAPNHLSYSIRTLDKEISSKLSLAGISIATYNKVLSLQNKLGMINSINIAEWLGMTARNARRILSELERSGLAQVIGEEAPTSKGRPRKIYRIGN